MKLILRIKSRNKLMKVQVDRENRIKKQNQNYVIVEILLDGMNLYYRPWHVVDVYLSIMTLLLSYDSLDILHYTCTVIKLMYDKILYTIHVQYNFTSVHLA